MNRAVRKFSRPVRAVILAVLVHVAFGLLLGLSLSFKPQVIEPSVAKPVKAIVIDRSAIEQEEKHKAEAKKKVETMEVGVGYPDTWTDYGKLTVKVNVTAHKFSGSAREAITSAGGTATEL